MNTSELKLVIEFVRDWNAGMSIDDMAKKYSIKPVTVRSRISAFRKKGINIQSRRAGLVFLKKDIDAINKAL